MRRKQKIAQDDGQLYLVGAMDATDATEHPAPTPRERQEAADKAEEKARRDNALTIAKIPGEVCPWPEVRAALIYRALSGHETYAYQLAEAGPWRIWDRQEGDKPSTFTLEAWRAHALELGLLDVGHVVSEGSRGDRNA